MNEIQTITNPAEAVPAMSPALLLHSIVKGGITQENVAVFEKAMEICFRMEQRDAERQFNQAFVKLQINLPVIVAESVIPNRGKYQKFEDLMRDISKPLQDNGFSVAFNMEAKDGRVTETCTLSHVGGHSRSNGFSVRPGKGDNDAQADCKAATIAKRNALCNALNLTIRQDCLTEEHDPHIEGDTETVITKAQADALAHRCALLDCRQSFLNFAKVKSFAEIPASQHERLERMLTKKETSK